MKTTALFALLVVAGCGAPKSGTLDDDFSMLDGADEKSDVFSTNWKLAGTLSYGDSRTTLYSNPPRYRAYKFAGVTGDEVSIDVSSSAGDSVAWLLDSKYAIVASNDDASGSTLDSHIDKKLTKSGTYYVALRDYYLESHYFTVKLAKKNVDFFSCNRDSDCEKTYDGCCQLNSYVAVKTGTADGYHASLGCAQFPVCPRIAIRQDFSMAECNYATKKCEIVQPHDIACGGHTVNPHACPSDWTCNGPNLPVDGTGQCNQDCTSSGVCSESGYTCQSGLCKPAPADCRTTGCAAGRKCDFCWGGYSCIPVNAIC